MEKLLTPISLSFDRGDYQIYRHHFQDYPGYQTFMFRRPYLPPGSELTYEKQKNRKKPSWFEVSFTIWESNENASESKDLLLCLDRKY